MAKSIHKEILSLTTSAGTGTANTTSFLKGILREIIVSPATPTTTYNVSITSPESRSIYERTSETGDLADVVVIPVRGNHTVTVSGANADELFTINLVVEE